MTPSAPSHNGSDSLLADVVEEFTNRVQAGEPVDVESYVARHPEHAERLRQLLPALALLADLGRSVSAASDGTTARTDETPLSGVLGDFRLLREVGKGGMGIVYEAEQISLRRRVALKVLPFAATMDPRHLQRFHNEAQAAACLHHTNIVPVYFVGCERGVHFYAMQFIDGQPLSELIHQQRQREEKTAEPKRKRDKQEQTTAYQPAPESGITAYPTAARAGDSTPLSPQGRRGRDYYRRVAELGAQAAEALDHAHQVGIVHRDIKPANLLLDGRGNLWVTDFGLAHVQRGDAGLTLTGQTVGTPRYMSPEQVMAKRVPIDHRTDVYSLGATLYELLTLRPVFQGERDDVLRQVAFEDPTRPRRLERGIPEELETIVLKAMEKRPQDRYATARDLADDLRRWLLDQPLRARRPSVVQGMRKWVRRHKAAVRAASVLLLALLLLGFGHAVWWVKKQTAAETEAQAALQETEHWQQEERWSEALSVVRRVQAILRDFGSSADLRQQADQRAKDLEMAQRLEETRLLMTTLKDGWLDVEASMAGYTTAFAWYGLDVEQGDVGDVAEHIRSRSIRMQLIAALDHWALLQWSREGRQWRHLLAVARAADADQWRNRLRDAWERRDGKAMDALLSSAEVEKLLPTTLSLLGYSQDKQIGVSGKQAATLLRRAQQRHPADFWINHDLARLLQMAQPPQLEEAIGYYRAAVALRPQSSAVHNNFGIALAEKGQLDEAIAEFRESLRLNDDASTHFNLGMTLKRKRRLDDAIGEFREAIHRKQDKAAYHYYLGLILYEKGQRDESIEEFRKAVSLKRDYVEAHNTLGNALQNKGLLDEALSEYREVIRLKKDDAVAHYGLADTLRGQGRLDEAVEEYRAAIHFKRDYAEAHCNLGQTHVRQGKFRQAVEEIRRGHELGSRRPDWPYPSATWLNTAENLARIETRWPALLKGQESPKNARERLALAQLCQSNEQLFAAASRWYGEAFTEEPRLADDLNNQHRYSAGCAAALAGCGQGKDADKLDAKERTRMRQRALDWLRADLKAYCQVLEKAADKAGPEIAQRMQHWLQDDDFAGVRGNEARVNLPEAERREWNKLWEEVATLRRQAAQEPKKESSARP